MNEHPLVSCIMPTYNRRKFVPLAIKYFLRQDYPNKELIILDDGTDRVRDLVPNVSEIKYHELPSKLTVGAKRNQAIEMSQGEIILHWDDDDWHAPQRITYQVKKILHSSFDLCGISTLLFYDTIQKRAWKYIYPASQRFWLSGSSLCYARSFWLKHKFPNLNVGEDSHFVWSDHPKRMTNRLENTFQVGIIHPYNVSPKQTGGAYWQPYSVEEIQRLLGDDWELYQRNGDNIQIKNNESFSATVPSIRNIFACLVHENLECVIDLVRNLRYHDPSSFILLYDGSKDQSLLDYKFPFTRYGAIIHPKPRPLTWGRLHDFALDCMKFAIKNIPFDIITIVDSDQLAARPGYSNLLSQFFASHSGIGMLGNSPELQLPNNCVGPAAAAFKEIDLWRPFLKRFTDGEKQFVHWSFWPSTIFTAEAARELVQIFDIDEQLQDIIRHSRIWATEEVILPTLIALLGYKIERNPCCYDYVKYRINYSLKQINMALDNPNVYWFHPIPRRYNDNLRQYLRKIANHYESSHNLKGAELMSETKAETLLLLTIPILKRMRAIEGWLDDEEADLLIAVTFLALTKLTKPHAIIEIGSYCGRSTIVIGSVLQIVCQEAKIYAIDPHDGKVGALDQGIRQLTPTLTKFRKNVDDYGLTNWVELIQKHSFEVPWEMPISLLFIDGLHDYANVARDFFHFEKWIRVGGYVVFHDYADYYPGVKAFVNEILASRNFKQIHLAGSLIVIQKQPSTELINESF